MRITENNENRYQCAQCGGACCKQMGCCFSPTDFDDLSFEGLKQKITETGYISIDWWEEDEPLYFLRMRHVDAAVVDPSYGGQCCKLTPNGCTFDFEHRPYEGKSLIPKTTYNGRCTVTYSKHDCAVEWTPYAAILTRLYEEF